MENIHEAKLLQPMTAFDQVSKNTLKLLFFTHDHGLKSFARLVEVFSGENLFISVSVRVTCEIKH